MATQPPTPGPSQLAITAQDQYRECAASWRAHDRNIWQIPAVIALLDGAGLVSAFGLPLTMLMREAVVGVALLLTLALTYALAAHRHWAQVERQTLVTIEVQAQQVPLLHWPGPRDRNARASDYWHTQDAPWWYWKSAYVLLFIAMLLVIVLLIALLVLNPIFPDLAREAPAVR
ncbi:MAG: hypothetical protein HYY00_00485 [Chloroflexi bacterium]|nr:hypothetical protein [Chloroflexota bacterium]